MIPEISLLARVMHLIRMLSLLTYIVGEMGRNVLHGAKEKVPPASIEHQARILKELSV